MRGKKSFLGVSLNVLMRYKKRLYTTMNVKSEIYGLSFRKTILDNQNLSLLFSYDSKL